MHRSTPCSRALKKNDRGAGRTIAAHERSLMQPEAGLDILPVTVSRQIPQSWTDYNGHMNEARYLDVFAQATDRIMELIGADADYVAAGRSYFTVETHLRYLAEVRGGDRGRVTTQLLGADGRKLHLFPPAGKRRRPPRRYRRTSAGTCRPEDPPELPAVSLGQSPACTAALAAWQAAPARGSGSPRRIRAIAAVQRVPDRKIQTPVRECLASSLPEPIALFQVQ